MPVSLTSMLFTGKYAAAAYAPVLPFASARTRPSDYVLNFDDIADASASGIIPAGYGGLTWDGIYVIPRADVENFLGTGTGFTTGTVSDPNIAYTDGGNDLVTLTSGGANFTLRSVYLTAGVRDGMTVEVRAFDDGVQKYAQTLTLNDDNETLFAFNFKAIDTVTFQASGGTPTNADDQSFYVVMDNMQLSAPVGSISGTVFSDRNGNGIRNARDPGLFDQLVYVDLNDNGTYDRGELRTRTLEDGSYTITNVPFGTYDVRVSVSAKYTVTSPTNPVDTYTSDSAAFQWVDIEQSANQVSFSSLDDGFTTFNVPELIDFYGEEYGSFSISTNGLIAFGGSFGSSFGNTTLPSDKADTLIAPMWNDFDLRDGGAVYAFNDTANARVIVTWADVRYYTDGSAPATETSTFQAVIGYDGTIRFNYEAVAGPIADVGDFTIGVSDETGEFALQVANGTTPPANGSTILLQPTVTFVTGVANDVVVDSGRDTDAVNFGVARLPTPAMLEAPMGLEFLAMA